MRWLRGFCNWGLCPQTPAIYRCCRQNSCIASQLGAAPPNPFRAVAEGRRVRRLPAIPAAESALGLRRRRALSSAQVLPEWTTITEPCNNFAANGDECLNFVSRSRGSLQSKTVYLSPSSSYKSPKSATRAPESEPPNLPTARTVPIGCLHQPQLLRLASASSSEQEFVEPVEMRAF
jgi:hypothetical protein